MGLEKELEDSTSRLDEAVELLNNDSSIDTVCGVVKGLFATVDGVRSCIAHPYELAYEETDN
jgi:hypothetical protein